MNNSRIRNLLIAAALWLLTAGVASAQCGSNGTMIFNPLANGGRGGMDCTGIAGGGSGTVSSVTVNGTSRKISVSGTCTITTTGTCTITLPTDLLMPALTEATTQAVSDVSTKLATTEYVGFKVPITTVTIEAYGGGTGASAATNLTAFNSAITALAAAGGGILQYGAGTYNTNIPLTVSASNITVTGAGMRATVLSTTDSTNDFIQFAGGGTGNCAASGIFFSSLSSMELARTTPATTGNGVSISKGCWIKVTDVESRDSIYNFYVNLSGNTLIQDTQSYHSTSSGTARAGHAIDGHNASTRLKHNVVACTGSNITGLYIFGGWSADKFVEDYETAACDYGVYLDGGSPSSDIHFTNIVSDQTKITGFYINNLSAANNSQVFINGLYVQAITPGTTIGVELAGTTGSTTIVGLQTVGMGTGVKIGTTANGNKVTSSSFTMCTTCVSVLGSENIINDNVFNSTSAGTTTYVSLGASTVANIVKGNIFRGFATTALSVNASSTLNQFDNICDATNITTCTSNSGAGNDFGKAATYKGVAAPTLNVASCSGAALGTGSTNDAGTITGITATGTCTIVITFGTVIATNGWICSVNNRVTVANPFQQKNTGNSTTAATIEGTTVSGDALGYRCSWY